MLLQLLLITFAVIVGIIAAPYIVMYPVVAATAICMLIVTVITYRIRKKGAAK